MTIISESFLVSADLGIRAIIFAVIIGILLGAVAAIKRGSVWDSVSMFIAMIGVSVPSFILGAVLQYFLGLQLRKTFGINLFPIQGWGKFNQTLLPSFALGLGSLATVSRLMRTSMLDVLGQDYIKTAKSKGLSQGKILWRHALRNAIMPVVAVVGDGNSQIAAQAVAHIHQILHKHRLIQAVFRVHVGHRRRGDGLVADERITRQHAHHEKRERDEHKQRQYRIDETLDNVANQRAPLLFVLECPFYHFTLEMEENGMGFPMPRFFV